MKYVVVYGEREGYAIGEIEVCQTKTEAEKLLEKRKQENPKPNRKFWIQGRIL